MTYAKDMQEDKPPVFTAPTRWRWASPR